MIIDFSQRKMRSKLIIPPKKKFQPNNPFIHSQIYSLSSTVTEKKATSSNQAIRPVESSSSARRGPSTRRSEGEGRKEGIVGVLLARSVPVGFTPPPPVRPNWKSGKRGSVKAARFWATPDPFNELVIAFWAGHPSPLPTGAVATGLVFCFCRPRSTIPSPSTQHLWEARARRHGCDHPWAASESGEGEEERIWISCRWRLLYMWVTGWKLGLKCIND